MHSVGELSSAFEQEGEKLLQLLRQGEMTLDSLPVNFDELLAHTPPKIMAPLLAYQAIHDLDHLGDIAAYVSNPTEAVLQLREIFDSTLRFDVAKNLLNHYCSKWPDESNLSASRDFILGYQGMYDSFRDSQNQDVQILRKDNATTTIAVFCGAQHGFGFPINVLHHCWLSRRNANVVYLRDFSHRFYVAGIQSLGESVGRTLEHIRKVFESLDTKKVIFLGYSAGTFGALYYGALLNINEVIAFSGPTSLEIGFQQRHVRPRWKRLFEEQGEGMPCPDLRALYTAMTSVKASLYFGGDHEHDREQANNLANLSNVRIYPLDSANHFVMNILAQGGTLERMLETVEIPSDRVWRVEESFVASNCTYFPRPSPP